MKQLGWLDVARPGRIHILARLPGERRSQYVQRCLDVSGGRVRLQQVEERAPARADAPRLPFTIRRPIL